MKRYFIAIVALLLFPLAGIGQTISADEQIHYGPPIIAGRASLTDTTALTLPNENDAIAVAFVARYTNDISKVKVNFVTVTTAGTVTLRIETDTAGQPSGTLYDAKATVVGATPAAGINTFDMSGDPPTTGLTVGSRYWVVVKSATASAALTISAVHTQPYCWKSSAGGAYAIQASAASSEIEFESGVFYDTGAPAIRANTVSTSTYGNNMYSGKVVTTTALTVSGIYLPYTLGVGGPTADLRLCIRAADGNPGTIIDGTTITVAKEMIATANGNLVALFPGGNVSLPAGTYRIVADLNTGGDSTHYVRFRSADYFSASSTPSNFRESLYNGSAWTDDTDRVAGIGFILAAVPTPAASGGGTVHFIR